MTPYEFGWKCAAALQRLTPGLPKTPTGPAPVPQGALAAGNKSIVRGIAPAPNPSLGRTAPPPPSSAGRTAPAAPPNGVATFRRLFGSDPTPAAPPRLSAGAAQLPGKVQSITRPLADASGFASGDDIINSGEATPFRPGRVLMDAAGRDRRLDPYTDLSFMFPSESDAAFPQGALGPEVRPKDPQSTASVWDQIKQQEPRVDQRGIQLPPVNSARGYIRPAYVMPPDHAPVGSALRRHMFPDTVPPAIPPATWPPKRKATTSLLRQTPHARLAEENPYLSPDTFVKTRDHNLFEELARARFYDSVGGTNKAVDSAIAARNNAVLPPYLQQLWQKDDLFRSAPVTSIPVPAKESLRSRGLAIGGYAKQPTGEIAMRSDLAGRIDPETLEHELTHANLQHRKHPIARYNIPHDIVTGEPILDGYYQPQAQDKGYDAHERVSGELVPGLAQLKRLYAGQKGKLIETPEQAAEYIQSEWPAPETWQDDGPSDTADAAWRKFMRRQVGPDGDPRQSELYNTIINLLPQVVQQQSAPQAPYT